MKKVNSRHNVYSNYNIVWFGYYFFFPQSLNFSSSHEPVPRQQRKWSVGRSAEGPVCTSSVASPCFVSGSRSTYSM